MTTRSRVRLAVSALAMSFALIAASSARADDNPGDDKWHFEIAPYIWAPGLNGDTGVRGRTVPVDADFAQVVHDSDSIIGAMLHAEAGRGPWSAFVDATYAKIGVDEFSSPFAANISTTFSTLWLEGGGAYRFLNDMPLGASDSKLRFSADGLLGARLTVLGLGLDAPDVGIDIDQTTAWVDPFIGARCQFDFGDHWALRLRGDVGGFGAGSQFSWQAAGLIGYRFNIGTVASAVFVGYRALGQDFVSSGFTWDMVVHGPMVGISFNF